MILGGLGGLEAYLWEDFLHNRLLLKFQSSSTSLAVLHWTPLDSTLAASKGTCLNPNGMRRSPRSGLNQIKLKTKFVLGGPFRKKKNKLVLGGPFRKR